jgi:hypothetical protein
MNGYEATADLGDVAMTHILLLVAYVSCPSAAMLTYEFFLVLLGFPTRRCHAFW